MFTPLNINYHGDKIKKNEIDERVERTGNEKCVQNFDRKNLKVREHFGDESVNRGG
jgi:hypothetical protein